MNLKNGSTEKRYNWLFKHHVEMSVGGTGYVLYNTVHAVAHALHEMLLQEVDTWTKYSRERLEFDSWEVICIPKDVMWHNK